MTKRLSIYIISFIILLVVVLFILNRLNGEGEVGPEVPPPGDKPAITTPNEEVKPAENGKSGQAVTVSDENTKQREKEESLKKLQALTDALGLEPSPEETQEALKLALDLAEKGDGEQKIAAIETLKWIGGHEAKMTMVNLLEFGGEVKENATAALQYTFTEDAQDSNIPFDTEAFSAAVLQLKGTDRDTLFVVLDGYPVETQAPVLIKLMDSQDEALREVVFEHFASMAEGEEITNKEAAEKWLAKYLADNKAE